MMDLKTQDGFELIKSEEVKKIGDIKQFIPVVRNSVSKAWRLMDKLDKMLNMKGDKT